MNSIVVGGYINTYVENPRGGHRKPYVIIVGISDHKNGHFVRPNMV
jgi:hypothetical protein